MIWIRLGKCCLPLRVLLLVGDGVGKLQAEKLLGIFVTNPPHVGRQNVRMRLGESVTREDKCVCVE
jgi:hypothetical protein